MSLECAPVDTEPESGAGAVDRWVAEILAVRRRVFADQHQFAHTLGGEPFRLGELVARLKAHLRQHALSEDAVLAIGPYTFKPNVKMLIEEKANKKIRLTEKETSILKYLYRAGQKAVGRDTLLGEVWGYNAGVTTHTLETHIYRLRQKIEKDPAKATILVTDAGGYRLVP